MKEIENLLHEQLSSYGLDNRLRKLRNVMPGEGAHILVDRRPLVNFASNDYMGLSTHPMLKQRTIEYVERFGVGNTASRLLCGNIEPYEYIERKLASLKGTETALIFPTGFQANITTLSTLSGVGSLIALDKSSHTSLLQGVQLSGAHLAHYDHNNMTHLDESLTRYQQKGPFKWVVSESVFSMEGDRVDVASLLKVARAHDASVFLDEAHATGVLGEFGMGLSVGHSDIEIVMGTFGKACGSFGAYIACSHMLKDYLVNCCAGLVYSTALPPAVLGAIDAALDVIPTMEKQRQLLQANAERLRSRIHKMGFETGGSCTQIIPIIVGSDNMAVALADHLQDGGIFAPAIRPGAMADRSSCVKLSLTINHSSEHLERVATLLRSFHAH